jgi:CheY-like chemotaxis protein
VRAVSESSADTPLVVSVEDNPADVRLIEEGISTVGGDITLHVFNNGQTAVEQLIGAGDIPIESIDLVFLDLNIPGKSGLEILRRLREDTQFDTVPIVTVSSSENPEDISRVYGAAGNAYIKKPTDPDTFIQKIAAAVRFWIHRITIP